MVLTSVQWIDYVTRGLVILAGLSLCMVLTSALATMWRFIRWAKEEAAFRREEALWLRTWADGFAGRVDGFMARVDLSNFKAAVTEQVTPETVGEGYVNMSPVVRPPFGPIKFEHTANVWVREQECAGVGDNAKTRMLTTPSVGDEYSRMTTRSAAVFEKYRLQAEKEMRRRWGETEWGRTQCDASPLATVWYNREQDAVTLAGWSRNLWEAKAAVPKNSNVSASCNGSETTEGEGLEDGACVNVGGRGLEVPGAVRRKDGS